MSNQVKEYILITGAAGFIGAALSEILLINGYCIIGIDNINDYYDIKLKIARNEILKKLSKKNGYNFKFFKINIDNQKKIEKIFKRFDINNVINLAAQAGVRYSILGKFSIIVVD